MLPPSPLSSFSLVSFVSGRLRGRAREQQIQQPLFHRGLGLGLDLVPFFGLDLGDGQLHQVPDHGFHVPAHIAHLGEFRGLDLEERRGGELGQSPGDLGLAHPGGADHDDILGGDLVPEVLGDLLAPPAVPQRDGHRALGVVLPHDIFVQLRHGLPGGQMIPGRGE